MFRVGDIVRLEGEITSIDDDVVSIRDNQTNTVYTHDIGTSRLTLVRAAPVPIQVGQTWKSNDFGDIWAVVAVGPEFVGIKSPISGNRIWAKADFYRDFTSTSRSDTQHKELVA